jgi:ribonuclease HI
MGQGPTAGGYGWHGRREERWVGIKTHMGYNQEAFDAECAALARALEVAARRRTTPERVTIFTDASCHQAHGLRGGRSMLSRPESGSRPYEGSDRTSRSRSGGGRLTRGYQTMKKWTSGQSWQQRSRTPGELKGCAGQTNTGGAPHAPAQIARKSQAGGLGEEADSGPALGGGTDPSEKV